MATPSKPLVITWDDERFTAEFNALARRMQDTTPLMADIAEALLDSANRRFDSGVAPDGTQWAPLADGSGRTPLTLTGVMRTRNANAWGRDWAEVFNSAKQALWQHEGTDPFTIVPRNARALAFGNSVSIAIGKRKGQAGKSVVVAKVDHPGLPARRWIGLSRDDEDTVFGLVRGYLEGGLDG